MSKKGLVLFAIAPILAVEKRFRTSEQVSRLLEIQNLHDQLYLAENWVLEGKIDVPSLINRLATFLGRRDRQGQWYSERGV